MDFDFSLVDEALGYKLLSSLVIPRPIAFISSLGANGVVNAAPYSFFNLMGDDPPILIVSMEQRAEGGLKDSARNILEAGEFVVNLVDEALAERMHAASTAFPPEVSEPAALGLALAASSAVKPPRLAEAPVAIECTLLQQIAITATRNLFIGQVRWLHVRDGILDPATLRVDLSQYFPVGRLFADRYCRTRDQFTIASSPEYLARIKAAGRL